MVIAYFKSISLEISYLDVCPSGHHLLTLIISAFKGNEIFICSKRMFWEPKLALG